jgi:hypothetical protein
MQGKRLYLYENNSVFSHHFGQKAQITASSLFFSLLAAKTLARTVRVGLRGAPFFPIDSCPSIVCRRRNNLAP